VSRRKEPMTELEKEELKRNRLAALARGRARQAQLREDEITLSSGSARLLEEIRSNGRGNDTTLSVRHTGTASDEISGTQSIAERIDRGNEESTGGTNGRTQTSNSIERTAHGYDQGSRSTQPTDINSSESANRNSNRPQELIRQRIARAQQRAKEKTQPTTGVHPGRIEQEQKPKFQIKVPFLEKIKEDKQSGKLFTIREADEALEDMTTMYVRGSQLLDECLEIIVKGHEEVAIWTLDEEDARMMARLHLERAKVDKGAAQAARALLALHDRFLLFMIIAPRVKITVSLIAERGLSFK
jgi:hypothetical protein